MKKYLVLILMCVGSFCLGQDKLQENVDVILKKSIQSNHGPGVTAGIVKDGKLIYQNSFGNMNLEYDIPFNDSTLIGLASVTKQFTSACIGVLENKGRLSVEDDIRTYIPELNFYGDTIRIKHLLSHTSGIRNHNVLLDLMGFDYVHQGYSNEIIEQLMFRQKGVNNLPGEKMLYSNTNYVLLALLVKKVSGLPIHEFAYKELFEPLGMYNTFYRSDLNEVIKNSAYTYFKRGDMYKQPRSVTLCVGAGGMKSTIADLAKWSQVFLDPNHKYAYLGKFITQTDILTNGQAMSHARGMFVSPYKGFTTFNHSGRDRGMRSQFICIPEENLGVIVYANSSEINAVEISYQILDLFLEQPQKSSEEMASISSKKGKKRKSYTGVYQELNSDLRMKIFVENDTLKAQSSLGNQSASLVAYGINSFHRVDNPSVKYIFPSEKSDEVDMMVDFGGAIFYFEEVELDPSPNQNLVDYVGSYYSAELDVTYLLSENGSSLTLDYPHNTGITLKEGQEDVFGSNRRTKYAFYRDGRGKVSGFRVSSEGTVKNIVFEKMD